MKGPAIGSVSNNSRGRVHSDSDSGVEPAYEYYTSLYMITGGAVRSQTAHAQAALG